MALRLTRQHPLPVLYAKRLAAHLRSDTVNVRSLIFGQHMPVDLHYVCKLEMNYKPLEGDTFETGNWVAADLLSSLAVGGRIFLHTAKKEPAWHGGTIIRYQSAPSPQEERKVFICRRDFDYKVLCPAPWGQEKAVARWNEERSVLMSQREYLKMIKSRPPQAASNSG